MKHTVLFLFTAFCSTFLFAQKRPALEITIENINSDNGNVMVALFNDEKSFTKNPWKGEKTKAKAGAVTIRFEEVPNGKYAVAVYHDANENGKLDSGFMGIPKEGFGFSNNAMGTFGPPSFEKASIQWTGTSSYTIRLRYF